MSIKDQFISISNTYKVKKEPWQIADDLQELIKKLPNSSHNFVDLYTDSISQYEIEPQLVLTFKILSEVKFKGYSIEISELLMKYLLKLKLNFPGTADFVSMMARAYKDCVDPEVLHNYCKMFEAPIDNEELLEYAAYLILMKHMKKGIVLLKNFGLIKEFTKRFNLVPLLIEDKGYDLLKLVIDKDKDMAANAINCLCDFKVWDQAETLINFYQLIPADFPYFIKKTKKRALEFFFKDGVIIRNLIDLSEKDKLSLAALIEILLENSEVSQEHPWMNKIAFYLAQKNPEAMNYIKPELKIYFNNMPIILHTPQEDIFGPITANCGRMPEIPVTIIDTEELVNSLNWEGLNMVALDTEWKTELGKYSSSRVSILQIALPGQVFIVDLLQLNQVPALDTKLFNLLSSAQIYKLGIQFDGDLTNLRNSYKHMLCFQEKVVGYIDLLEVYKRSQKVNPGGLASLAEIIIGTQMCKVEQKSNWELRPLRYSQLHYACVDAYICLGVYCKLATDEIVIESDIVTIGGSTIRSNDNTPMAQKCEICKSRVHTIENCLHKIKCRVCGAAWHTGESCPCYGLA